MPLRRRGGDDPDSYRDGLLADFPDKAVQGVRPMRTTPMPETPAREGTYRTDLDRLVVCDYCKDKGDDCPSCGRP